MIKEAHNLLQKLPVIAIKSPQSSDDRETHLDRKQNICVKKVLPQEVRNADICSGLTKNLVTLVIKDGPRESRAGAGIAMRTPHLPLSTVSEHSIQLFPLYVPIDSIDIFILFGMLFYYDCY